jgi:hypothetical protein
MHASYGSDRNLFPPVSGSQPIPFLPPSPPLSPLIAHALTPHGGLDPSRGQVAALVEDEGQGRHAREHHQLAREHGAHEHPVDGIQVQDRLTMTRHRHSHPTGTYLSAVHPGFGRR